VRSGAVVFDRPVSGLEQVVDPHCSGSGPSVQTQVLMQWLDSGHSVINSIADIHRRLRQVMMSTKSVALDTVA
jgi:hypothetical protein